MRRWWLPSTWFRRRADLEKVDELSEARARYQAALGSVRATTAQISGRRSTNLDEVEQAVHNADQLMQEALGAPAYRRRMPSRG